jgi:hypothetical protein
MLTARDALLLADLLRRVLEISEDTGVATGGTNVTVVDAGKNWGVNMWQNATVHVIKPGGIEYVRLCTANDATTLTIAALPMGVSVVAGDAYAIRRPITAADITDRWARQLGQVDIARVLGAALSHANPVISRITDGVGFIALATETTLTKLIPIAKAAIFNAALPAAETAWLGADIVPTNSPSYLRVHVAVAVAGVLRIARTVGGVTVVEDLNAGVALVANSAYSFVAEWRTGDSINFRYSATGANILVFRANEIGGAI